MIRYDSCLVGTVRFVDEHDGSGEPADLGQRRQRAERDVGVLGPAVVGVQADGDHLRRCTLPVQFSDLADCVVLPAAGTGGQGFPG